MRGGTGGSHVLTCDLLEDGIVDDGKSRQQKDERGECGHLFLLEEQNFCDTVRLEHVMGAR